MQKNPDFAAGYEGMTSYEVTDRLTIVRGKTGPPPVTPLPQTAVFHPIGFPGRYARVETNVVIIDDNWIMSGGATIRRRGLTFHGSSDVVLTDTLIENGRSVAIRAIVERANGQPSRHCSYSSQPSFVALNDPVTAFKVVRDALDAGGLGDISPVVGRHGSRLHTRDTITDRAIKSRGSLF